MSRKWIKGLMIAGLAFLLLVPGSWAWGSGAGRGLPAGYRLGHHSGGRLPSGVRLRSRHGSPRHKRFRGPRHHGGIHGHRHSHRRHYYPYPYRHRRPGSFYDGSIYFGPYHHLGGFYFSYKVYIPGYWEETLYGAWIWVPGYWAEIEAY